MPTTTTRRATPHEARRQHEAQSRADAKAAAQRRQRLDEIHAQTTRWPPHRVAGAARPRRTPRADTDPAPTTSTPYQRRTAEQAAIVRAIADGDTAAIERLRYHAYAWYFGPRVGTDAEIIEGARQLLPYFADDSASTSTSTTESAPAARHAASWAKAVKRAALGGAIAQRGKRGAR